jgi:RimJ/RimL family protein N-acetyltransferase
MRINRNLALRGERCLLVPYRPEHVPAYHAWMASPELQEATASEPLSLEAEFEMQRAWAEDEDKLTFIVLDPAAPATPGVEGGGGAGMAGDVNLFLNDPDDRSAGEVEIMIAEPASRRRGLATEALQLFMAYAFGTLGVSRFVAKIGEANAPSLALFQRLGFVETRRVAAFREAHLELAAGAHRARLIAAFGALDWINYDYLGQKPSEC